MTHISRDDRFGGLVLVIAIACSSAVFVWAWPAMAGGIATDAQALAKLDEDWSAAAATRDPERVASFYAEDAIAYPPNEPVAVGRAAAKNIWAAYFADPSFSISWKTLHAEVSKGGDLGFTSGTYVALSKGPDGKPLIDNGKFLCVWKKDDKGNWKAVQDMWNTDTKVE